MNRWLYRAAGSVGLAGGFLLLGAGAAQAEDDTEAQRLDGLLGDVFSPTAGLPPLPSSDDELPVADMVTLRQDDGRLGTGPTLPTDGLPVGELPLDGLPVNGLLNGGLPVDGLLGGGLPVDGLLNGGLPVDGLLGGGLPVDGLLNGGLPVDGLLGDGLPVDVPVDGLSTDGLVGTELPLPVADGTVGDVPHDGQALDGLSLDGLPVDTSLLGQLTGVTDAVGSPAALPASIGDDLAAQHGLAEFSENNPELVDGGLPLVDDLPLAGQLPVAGGLADGQLPLLGDTQNLTGSLAGFGGLAGVSDLAGQLPVAGPLADTVTDLLPVGGVGTPAPPPVTVPEPQDPVTLPASAEHPREGEVNDRPVAGEDPMFAEHATADATGAPLTDALPASQVAPLLGSTLGQLPVLGELDVLDTASGPVAMVRSLPVAGQVTGSLL